MYVKLSAIPLSLSLAVTFTAILLLVVVPLFTVTLGAVPSVMFVLAYCPAFIPSVSLAYTVSPWFKPLTVPPFSIVVHVPAIEFT